MCNYLLSMNCRKFFVYFVAIFTAVVLLLVVLSPGNHLKLGDVFFGRVPSLYNVNLAQRFYIYASYPLLGNEKEFAHYQLSRTYFIKGDLEEALKEAKLELEKYPDNDRTYYILGLTLGYMDRELEAIEAFSEFIEVNPNSWAARNDKAWLQFRIGDINGALETIEPVSNVLNPWVKNTYGTILLNSNRKDEARQAFLDAKAIVERMSEEDWGRAYPGNDPRIYQTGLSAMMTSIDNNLKLTE